MKNWLIGIRFPGTSGTRGLRENRLEIRYSDKDGKKMRKNIVLTDHLTTLSVKTFGIYLHGYHLRHGISHKTGFPE